MNHSIKGIYVHIPFCKSKCNYCSFYSVANQSRVLEKNYTTRLVEEISKCSYSIEKLNSLYIGGGTPSLLEINSIREIINAFEQKFNFKLKEIPESTIEVNPGTANFNYLKMLKEIGFNRISLGLQSVNDYTLKAMGRIHTASDSLEILDSLDELGFNNVSVDLMFNYPGQPLFSTEQDILKLLEYECVKHFSVYSVTVEEKTKLYRQLKRGEVVLNDDRIERYLYYRIRDILSSHGVYQYEISNFAKPGYESQHNTLYWDRKNYISFGPASSSYIDNILIDHKPDLFNYLKTTENPAEVTELSQRELKEDFMIFGLRKTRGIFDFDYNRQFQSSFFIDFKSEIDKLVEDQLIETIPGGIKLSKLGIDFYDKVAIEFIN